MPTRTDRHQVFDGQGNVVGETTEVVDITAAVNRSTITADLLTGMAQLDQITATADVTFSNLAGAQAAMRQIQQALNVEARQIKRLTRLALGVLDGAN